MEHSDDEIQQRGVNQSESLVATTFRFIDDNFMMIYFNLNDIPLIDEDQIETRVGRFITFISRIITTPFSAETHDGNPSSNRDEYKIPTPFEFYSHYRTRVESVVNPFQYEATDEPTRKNLPMYQDYIRENVYEIKSKINDEDMNPNPPQEMYQAFLRAITVTPDDFPDNEGYCLFSYYRNIAVNNHFWDQYRRQHKEKLKREEEFERAARFIRQEVNYEVPRRTSVESLMSLHEEEFSKFKLSYEDREKLYELYLEECKRRNTPEEEEDTDSEDTKENISRVRQQEIIEARNFIITHGNYTTKYMRKSPESMFALHKKELSRFTHLLPEDITQLYRIYAAEWKRKREQGIVPSVESSPEKEAEFLTRMRELIDRLFLGHELRQVSKSDFQSDIINNFPEGMSIELLRQNWDKLFTYYRDRYTKLKEAKARQEQRDQPPILIDKSKRPVLPFPFRSPKKRYGFLDRNIQFEFNPEKLYLDRIPDKNVKSLKKFMRPNFSPKPYAWEIDHLQFDRNYVTYLFAININTRYLYVIKVRDKSAQSTIAAIHDLIQMEAAKGHDVRSIKGDGDKGFNNLEQHFARYQEIQTGMMKNREFYFQSSAYTYHNKTIDAAMRTLRDALGPNTNRFWSGRHDEIIQQLVTYYNNSWHRAIDMTPTEMHRDVELEWKYIRHMTEVLNEVKREQYRAMYFSYKPGQRLMLHLEFGKTSNKFTKRRRRFEHVGTFVEYRNGNVVVRVDEPIDKTVEVPIFYTRPIGRSSTQERDTFGGFREMDELN